MEFYVYGYKRENESKHGEIGTYYYIGKGTGNRAWKKSKGEIKPPKNKENIVFICQDMTEEDAFKLEISLIAKYGRIDLGTGFLRNRTDGGEGSSGGVWTLSDETKAKMSVAMMGKNKGKTLSDETKVKMSGANHHMYGKNHSDEAKAKMSVAKSGDKNPFFGKTHSDEQKAKLSIANSGDKNNMYGKTHSDETKAKISAINYGKTHSPETKAKISMSMKQIWASRRQESETFSLFC